MIATRFNKSEIMSQAWMMFHSSFYHFATFGEALKTAWRYAKEEVSRKEAAEARKAQQAAQQAAREAAREAAKVETQKDRFYREFNKTIAREYRNVTMGRNDWRVSYGRRYY